MRGEILGVTAAMRAGRKGAIQRKLPQISSIQLNPMRSEPCAEVRQNRVFRRVSYGGAVVETTASPATDKETFVRVKHRWETD